ncbi:gibberellin 2-beta-dioxygenase 2-like [Quercus lobata]|uniref:gibberellin 2beta-dioxygenase n=1 Tax=Quercus lobata TaxID=97700 RepID=A0A7N2RB10_QUELO|nr:gibberellin 2-beta-dioxygenase 2-like [Quercus lobata]
MATSSGTPLGSKNLPTIDLRDHRSNVSKSIVEACDQFGFFKVINHGVPKDIIEKVQQEGFSFFAKPTFVKQQADQASPANPLGYGHKNIGALGDKGELEYLLLSTHPSYIAEKSITISDDPSRFSSAVNRYIQAVRDLTCELLELIAEGLYVKDKSVFSGLIRDVESDSLLRLNYYLPTSKDDGIGFGEHSDPQLLSILTSNNVAGLQILVEKDAWISVPADPNAFWVIVGDMLQALTNGRFVSVRHRVLTNTSKPRISMVYFGAPSLQASISAPPELLRPIGHSLYRTFTWKAYKEKLYSQGLAATRLDGFKK